VTEGGRCPMFNKCFFVEVNRGNELLLSTCAEERLWRQCIYYRLCRDSRDVRECTRAIYRYQHEVEHLVEPVRGGQL